MKVPRLTIRRLMITTTITGILFGCWLEVERRRARFRAIAQEHWWGTVSPPGFVSEKKVAWHEAMAAKYHFAARHPRLPVAPDPPEPE